MKTSKPSHPSPSIDEEVTQFILRQPQGELLHEDRYLISFSGKIRQLGIKTVLQLIKQTPEQLKRHYGARDYHISRIKNVLRRYDLSLR